MLFSIQQTVYLYLLLGSWLNFSIKRPIRRAGTEVTPFRALCPKRVPGGGAKDVFRVNVMHENRNPQHRGSVISWEPICPIAQHPMMRPIIHHRKHLERSLAGEPGANQCDAQVLSVRFSSYLVDFSGRSTKVSSAICSTGPTPFTMFNRIIVVGILTRVP